MPPGSPAVPPVDRTGTYWLYDAAWNTRPIRFGPFKSVVWSAPCPAGSMFQSYEALGPVEFNLQSPSAPQSWTPITSSHVQSFTQDCSGILLESNIKTTVTLAMYRSTADSIYFLQEDACCGLRYVSFTAGKWLDRDGFEVRGRVTRSGEVATLVFRRDVRP
jgi:hypothetical protein